MVMPKMMPAMLPPCSLPLRAISKIATIAAIRPGEMPDSSKPDSAISTTAPTSTTLICSCAVSTLSRCPCIVSRIAVAAK